MNGEPNNEIKKPESRTRRILGYALKFGVPLVITVLLCRSLFTDVKPAEMWHIIVTQCDFGWILLALGISIFSHVFRAMRWRLQLQALGVDVPLFKLVLSIFGTYAINLVLPRLGEIWRSGYVARESGAKFPTIFGSMVADRLADTFTVLVLTVVTFLIATTQMSKYLSDTGTVAAVLDFLQSPWLWTAIVVCCALFWWFMVWKTDIGFVNRVQGFVRGIWQGFAAMAQVRRKWLWLLLTLCIWGCYFSQLYVAFFAFPFTTDTVARFGVLAVLVTFVLSSLSMGVPSNGGLGPWQWSVVLALCGFYGMGRPDAITFANTVMGMQTLLLIVLGIFTFVCISMSSKKVAANPVVSASEHNM